MNEIMSQSIVIKSQSTFLSDFIAITKKKSYPITQISGNTLLEKIAFLEGDNFSVEKLVIERILNKDIKWIDFLWIIGLFDNIKINQDTLESLYADSDFNASERILRIVENY